MISLSVVFNRRGGGNVCFVRGFISADARYLFRYAISFVVLESWFYSKNRLDFFTNLID